MIFYFSLVGVANRKALEHTHKHTDKCKHPNGRKTNSHFVYATCWKGSVVGFSYVFSLACHCVRYVPLQILDNIPNANIAYLGYSSISLSPKDLHRLLSIFILFGFNSARMIFPSSFFFVFVVATCLFSGYFRYLSSTSSLSRFSSWFIWLPRLRNIICQDDIANQFCRSFYLRCSIPVPFHPMHIHMRRMEWWR